MSKFGEPESGSNNASHGDVYSIAASPRSNKMQRVQTISVFAFVIFYSLNLNAQGYQGKYCELDGASTESGQDVDGECYMYSDQYGEVDGAETEDGESVSGECYRYSERYAELESAETESGESVSGECYFYNL